MAFYSLEMSPKERKAQTPEEMIQFAETLTVGLGGQDLRPHEELTDDG